MEPGWWNAPGTRAWTDGYYNETGIFYLDFGSADNCPTSGNSNIICYNQLTSNQSNCNCMSTWYQSDVYYVAWQEPPAYAVPEIYNSCWECQWAMISWYGQAYHSAKIVFDGPMDEQDLQSGTYSSQTAWQNLWNEINNCCGHAIASNMSYSVEIHKE